ncbi:MAG TPA: hypothetical protein VGE62_03815 [Candidatus Paceibacterota bacterium]
MNILSFIVLGLLINGIVTGDAPLMVAIMIWWLVGIYAAALHRQWENDRNKRLRRHRTKALYAWYSLSGFVFLLLTKVEQINAEISYIEARHTH